MKASALTFIFTLIITTLSFAADFTIGTAGNSFSPSTIMVQIGDRVTIQASASHPTTQVSQETWNANGTTPIGGSFVGMTSDIVIDITSFNTIFFVCENHVVSNNMKGQIVVTEATGVEESINKIGFNLISNPIVDHLLYSMETDKFVNSHLSIFSIHGAEMSNHDIFEPQGRIDLDLPAGQYIYVIRSREDELLASGKIVLIR